MLHTDYRYHYIHNGCNEAVLEYKPETYYLLDNLKNYYKVVVDHSVRLRKRYHKTVVHLLVSICTVTLYRIRHLIDHNHNKPKYI